MSSTDKGEPDRLTRPKRQVSRFVCQELLYDYYRNHLDDDRKSAVEVGLQTYSELQTELKQIKTAVDYCKVLSQTQLSASYVEKMKQVSPWTVMLFEKTKWKNWPEAVRWSTEAFAISLTVALVALFIPWHKIQNWIPKRDQAYVISHLESKPTTIVPPMEKTPPATTEIAKVDEPIKVVDPIKVPEPVKAAEPIKATEPVKTIAKSNETKTIVQKGLLYRFMMTNAQAGGIAQTLKDKIISLGGEKAGQVELGWKKKDPNGYYYHFTLPETNYNELVKTLGGYSPVRIYKNPHERVMPQGQIRIILWIEDKSENFGIENSPEQQDTTSSQQDEETTEAPPN